MPSIPPAEIFFIYTGLKRLIVFGAVTGNRYTFENNGARQVIDRRDAPGMLAVPMLKRVI